MSAINVPKLESDSLSPVVGEIKVVVDVLLLPFPEPVALVLLPNNSPSALTSMAATKQQSSPFLLLLSSTATFWSRMRLRMGGMRHDRIILIYLTELSFHLQCAPTKNAFQMRMKWRTSVSLSTLSLSLSLSLYHNYHTLDYLHI